MSQFQELDYQKPSSTMSQFQELDYQKPSSTMSQFQELDYHQDIDWQHQVDISVIVFLNSVIGMIVTYKLSSYYQNSVVPS